MEKLLCSKVHLATFYGPYQMAVYVSKRSYTVRNRAEAALVVKSAAKKRNGMLARNIESSEKLGRLIVHIDGKQTRERSL